METSLPFSCGIVSITADFATNCWPLMVNIVSELTFALERMVSAARRFVVCFGAFSLREFCRVKFDWILPSFCFAQGVSELDLFGCSTDSRRVDVLLSLH